MFTEREELLERTRARVALAYHMHHRTAVGPSWDACDHPLGIEVRCLLPALRPSGSAPRRRPA